MEAPPFTRLLADYLTDEAYRGLQAAVLENPELGDVMPRDKSDEQETKAV